MKGETQIDQGVVKKRKRLSSKTFFIAGMAAVIAIQLVILAFHFPRFNSTANPWNPVPQSSKPFVDVLFTSDSFGTLRLHGCERIGSLARRAAIIRKFSHYLYLDAGNLTSDDTVFNKAMLPFLEEALMSMGLRVLNLTKQDFLHLSEASYSLSRFYLVSANLRGRDRESRAGCVLDRVSIPFSLKNKERTIPIMVGITGVTSNYRHIYNSDSDYTIEEIETALVRTGDTKEMKKADLKILLFNDSFFKLQKLLKRTNLGFHLVIATPTLPEHPNSMIFVRGTPVVFAQENGRTLGHVRVEKNGNAYSFSFHYYTLGMGIPPDPYTEEGLKGVSKILHNMRSTSR